MRALVTLLAAASALSLSIPALACGFGEDTDSTFVSPVVSNDDASTLLAEAARLDSVARSRDGAALTAERSAARFASRARELRAEARVAEIDTRGDLLALADTFDERADDLRARAQSLRAASRTLRRRADALRVEARRVGNGGQHWRKVRRPVPTAAI